jgi:hypothetical protein
LSYDVTDLSNDTLIWLGNLGEVGVAEIEFDLTDWQTDYPTGAAAVAANPGVDDGTAVETVSLTFKEVSDYCELVDDINLTVPRLYVVKTATRVDMYLLCSNKINYIQYTFIKVDNETINAYGWRIFTCNLCDINRKYVAQLTTNTEWDMALFISGAADFIGMGSHGSEIMDEFALYFDGASVAEDAVVSGEYTTVQLVHGSTMYHPSDEVTVVGYHRKTITVDARKRTLTLENHVKWSGSYTMGLSYMAMLPVLRDLYGPLVTDTFVDNADYIMTDCSTTTFDPGDAGDGAGKQKHGATEYRFWGAELGLYGWLKVLRRDPDLPNSVTYVTNAASYNKLYIDYCGPTYSVTTGDVWRLTTEIMIDCGKVT